MNTAGTFDLHPRNGQATSQNSPRMNSFLTNSPGMETSSRPRTSSMTIDRRVNSSNFRIDGMGLGAFNLSQTPPPPQRAQNEDLREPLLITDSSSLPISGSESVNGEENGVDKKTKPHLSMLVTAIGWVVGVLLFVSVSLDVILSVLRDLKGSKSIPLIPEFRRILASLSWLGCFYIYFVFIFYHARLRKRMNPFRSRNWPALLVSLGAGVILITWTVLFNAFLPTSNASCSITRWVVLFGYAFTTGPYLLRAIRLYLLFRAADLENEEDNSTTSKTIIDSNTYSMPLSSPSRAMHQHTYPRHTTSDYHISTATTVSNYPTPSLKSSSILAPAVSPPYLPLIDSNKRPAPVVLDSMAMQSDMGPRFNVRTQNQDHQTSYAWASDQLIAEASEFGNARVVDGFSISANSALGLSTLENEKNLAANQPRILDNSTVPLNIPGRDATYTGENAENDYAEAQMAELMRELAFSPATQQLLHGNRTNVAYGTLHDQSHYQQINNQENTANDTNVISSDKLNNDDHLQSPRILDVSTIDGSENHSQLSLLTPRPSPSRKEESSSAFVSSPSRTRPSHQPTGADLSLLNFTKLAVQSPKLSQSINESQMSPKASNSQETTSVNCFTPISNARTNILFELRRQSTPSLSITKTDEVLALSHGNFPIRNDEKCETREGEVVGGGRATTADVNQHHNANTNFPRLLNALSPRRNNWLTQGNCLERYILGNDEAGQIDIDDISTHDGESVAASVAIPFLGSVRSVMEVKRALFSPRAASLVTGKMDVPVETVTQTRIEAPKNTVGMYTSGNALAYPSAIDGSINEPLRTQNQSQQAQQRRPRGMSLLGKALEENKGQESFASLGFNLASIPYEASVSEAGSINSSGHHPVPLLERSFSSLVDEAVQDAMREPDVLNAEDHEFRFENQNNIEESIFSKALDSPHSALKTNHKVVQIDSEIGSESERLTSKCSSYELYKSAASSSIRPLYELGEVVAQDNDASISFSNVRVMKWLLLSIIPFLAFAIWQQVKGESLTPTRAECHASGKQDINAYLIADAIFHAFWCTMLIASAILMQRAWSELHFLSELLPLILVDASIVAVRAVYIQQEVALARKSTFEALMALRVLVFFLASFAYPLLKSYDSEENIGKTPQLTSSYPERGKMNRETSAIVVHLTPDHTEIAGGRTDVLSAINVGEIVSALESLTGVLSRLETFDLLSVYLGSHGASSLIDFYTRAELFRLEDDPTEQLALEGKISALQTQSFAAAVQIYLMYLIPQSQQMGEMNTGYIQHESDLAEKQDDLSYPPADAPRFVLDALPPHVRNGIVAELDLYHTAHESTPVLSEQSLQTGFLESGVPILLKRTLFIRAQECILDAIQTYYWPYLKQSLSYIKMRDSVRKQLRVQTALYRSRMLED